MTEGKHSRYQHFSFIYFAVANLSLNSSVYEQNVHLHSPFSEKTMVTLFYSFDPDIEKVVVVTFFPSKHSCLRHAELQKNRIFKKRP